MTLEEVVDPRIAVLIVWAIFFFVFIILPSICIRCLGCCTPYNPHNIDRDGIRGDEIHPRHEGEYNGWDRYMFLSAQKRQEIDELRSNVLRRYLVRFSMVLEEGHMMCLSESGEEAGEGAVVDGSCGELVNKEGLLPSDHDDRCLEEHDDDVECQIPIDERDMANPDDYIKETGLPLTEEEAELQKEKDFTANSDDAISNKTEADDDNQVGLIDIMAPAGNLHVLFDDTSYYHLLSGTNTTGRPKAQVTEIRQDSPLSGKIRVGDQLISIDDEDMTQMPGMAIHVLLFSKENAERKITVFRGEYDDEWEEGKKSSSEYTHVQIPFPGYDSHGKKAKEKKPIPEGSTKSHWRLFPTFFETKVQVVDNQQKSQEKNSADDNDDSNKNVRSSTERRNVPAFCAICLGEYEPSEPISWSSNPECTHVFHQECIIKWLNTLGRKISKYQRFSEDPPSAKQLLNYGLECPCCRQDFICKELILVEEEQVCGDEHV